MRSEIERALDDLISNEEGMRFQFLAAALAKTQWPDLVACERKKDLGADALDHPGGRAFCCSLTATLSKIRGDGREIKKHFPGVHTLVFATPVKLTNYRQHSEQWRATLRTDGFELAVWSREEIIHRLLQRENARLCRTHLGITVPGPLSPVEALADIRAALADICIAWSVPVRDKPLIDLLARRLDEGGAELSDLLHRNDILTALTQSRRVIVEAPAGRGKTTTLTQLANTIGTRGGVALLVDLSAWIRSGHDVLQYVTELPPFRSRRLDASTLATACAYEHVSILLNGWNELSESEGPAAATRLRELERSFPTAGIMVATRSPYILPPLPGAIRLRLRSLSRAQRSDYVTRRLGERAGELRRALDDDVVLHELTTTPLILSHICDLFAAGKPIPTTRMGVLQAAVAAIENRDEHLSHLQGAPLLARASAYLSALAIAVTSTGSVAIDDASARPVIAATAEQLRAAGQVAAVAEPVAILNALCDHHVLERRDYPSLAFAFCHQQFQEMYTARRLRDELTQLISSSEGGTRSSYLDRYVNEPAWEEPLRMLAEQLGSEYSVQQDATVAAAATALVTMAVDVDPVFAAELAQLCGASVSASGRSVVVGKLRRWYAVSDSSHEDCALAGMLASGWADFGDILIPLLTSSDQHTRLQCYRAGEGVRLSALGDAWRDVVRSWSHDARIDFFSELIHRRRTTDTLIAVAMSDTSPVVRTAAMSAYAWVASHEDLERALASADDDTFYAVVSPLPPREIPSALHERAIARYEVLLSDSRDPLVRLQSALRIIELGGAPNAAALYSALNAIPLQQLRQHEHAVTAALHVLRESESDWVSTWVIDRILSGALWHDSWITFVTSVPPDTTNTLLDRIEQEELSSALLSAITSILSVGADTVDVARLFARMKASELNRSEHSPEQQTIHFVVRRQINDLLRALPATTAIAGLAPVLVGPVELLDLQLIVSVFSSAERHGPSLREVLPEAQRQSFRGYLKKGVETALAADDFDGRLKAHLATTLSRVGQSEDMVDLEALIQADIARVRTAREARTRGGHGPRTQGANVSHANWFITAAMQLDSATAGELLLKCLSAPQYERDVAAALVRLASTREPEQPVLADPTVQRLIEARHGQPHYFFDEARRTQYAAELRAYVRTKLDANPANGAHADSSIIALARPLATLDGIASVDLILDVISAPAPWSAWARCDALEALMLRGVTLPAGRALLVVDLILEHIRSQSYDANTRWLLLRILRLLPFCEPLSVGIEKARSIIDEFTVHGYELCDLVTGVGAIGTATGLACLTDFASQAAADVRLGEAWANAVAAIDTPDSRQVLLGFVEPNINDPAEIAFQRADVLSARIADLAARDSLVQARLFALCNTQPPARRRGLLAQVMGRLTSLEAVLAGLNLIDDQSSPAIPTEIMSQVETAFVERRPYGGMVTAFTLHGREFNNVRTRLFEMSNRDEKRKQSAYRLLGEIERWRVEYGRPIKEVRHPALDTEVAWPVE